MNFDAPGGVAPSATITPAPAIVMPSNRLLRVLRIIGILKEVNNSRPVGANKLEKATAQQTFNQAGQLISVPNSDLAPQLEYEPMEMRDP